MSKADQEFIKTCKTILEHGTSTEGQKVRPHWEDGASAYTIKAFGVVNKYDLREEFPAITLRRTAIKSAMDEILWIYQKKSNNINDLNSHIWDSWADDIGSIGKAYGYQVGVPYIHHTEKYDPAYILEHMDEFNLCDDDIKGLEHEINLCKIDPGRTCEVKINRALDQMDGVLYDLKHSPFSRRIMLDLWNFEDLHEMNLQPCCWSVTFNVTDEGGDKLVLNMMLNQRSNDTLTANNWNVVQYATLLMMVAQVSDMIPGQLVHCITDAHIYDRHIPIVEELIKKPTYPAPKVTLNPDIKDFYKFTTKDITVGDYQYNEFNYKIPVAV